MAASTWLVNSQSSLSSAAFLALSCKTCITTVACLCLAMTEMAIWASCKCLPGIVLHAETL